MTPELLLLLVLLISLIIGLFIGLKRRKANILNDRIKDYSMSPIGNYTVSLFDKFMLSFNRFYDKMRPKISASPLFTKQSKRYEQFIIYSKKNKKKLIDFIIDKILVSLLLLSLLILSALLQLRFLALWEILTALLIGYYIPDFYFKIIQKSHLKKIQDDMLKAVIIMNNAFKGGKSTIQALEIAKNELPSPTNKEFLRMYNDVMYGLSLDVAFARFASRINLEEVRYITSSLTILQKTGGNIVKVFDSIERSLFDKKKLREELKNLTVNSNLVIKALLVIPLIFVGIIYYLNNDYFNPLFENTLGKMTIGAMVLLFGMYIFVLKKVMKVKV